MEYKLKKQFNYANKGDSKEATFVQCKEFSAKHLSKTAPIKQICIRAFNDIASKAEGVEDKEKKDPIDVTGEELMSALYMSNEDISQFFLYMKELLTIDELAMVDGEIKLTKPLWDELSSDDVEGLCGDYVLNFIIASVLKDSQRPK